MLNLDFSPHLPPDQIALRLLVALLLGALVGSERERRSKPAGLRTHMMVTLGAATFVILGFEAFPLTRDGAQATIDPTRIIQGVVQGIGFLGAGCIIQARGQVVGITTASSVWVAGAIGAACGVGAYVVAVTLALFAFLTLAVVGWIEHRVERATGKSKKTASNTE